MPLKIPLNQDAGTRNHGPSFDISKVETKYSPRIQHTAVNMAAPVKFIEAIRSSARIAPTTPPAGSEFAIGCQLLPNPNAAQVAPTNIAAPTTLAQGVWIGDERTQFHPSARIRSGIA